jgi:Mn-dependent DtxR family transcriptional regulator
MLMKLTHKVYRLSQLATELEATLQEADRNMARLTDSGLVSKNSEGDLVLTPYG